MVFPVTMRTSLMNLYDQSVDGSSECYVSPNVYAYRLNGNGRHVENMRPLEI